MDGLIDCACYLILIGVGSFVLGRALPKEWFSFEKMPYRSLPIEAEGALYNKFGIRYWKHLLPDMSKLFPKLIPSKKLPPIVDADRLLIMIRETCVAECIHTLLSVLGFGCVFIWKSVGGWVMSLLFLLGNLPYIFIQRHNRPKLIRLLNIMHMKNNAFDGKDEGSWSAF